MKERPILFSGDMVRAILEGRKTQTRRVVKPQPSPQPTRITYCGEEYGYMCESNSGKVGIFDPNSYKCPYGKPGDRLWVRETWRYAYCSGYTPINGENKFTCDIEYKCTYENPISGNRGGKSFVVDRMHYGGKLTKSGSVSWRPSIYLPRWASRITLEITGVRVERLNDISYHDAVAEGCGGMLEPATVYFQCVWKDINGKDSWNANPWVWVIEFRRVK